MAARALRLAVVPVGVAAGVAIELTFYDPELGPALTVADLVVGCVLLGCGALAWERRPESRVGVLMTLAGATWFLGSVFGPLVYLHRGPLVHLHLSYPSGRVRSRLVAAVIGAAYVDAAVEPIARNDVVTLALSGAIALTAVHVFAGTSGPARKAGGPALAAALAFAGVLAFGATARLAGWTSIDPVLWAYDVVIVCVAVVLVVDLLRSPWTDAVVTGLVVDLGTGAAGGTLRTKLADALGDPSLAVGYRLAETGGFVDETGRPVPLPAAGSGRTITHLVDRGEDVAVLVHDEALLADRPLVDSVAAAARMALANAELQAEARRKAAELEASRRRIVEAGDAERRRIQHELQVSAGRRLDRVASLLAHARAADPATVAPVEAELAEARRELEEFAQGVLPAALTEGGLLPALVQLAARSPVPVEVTGAVEGLPAAVESALFFVCSEALANVAKHASASRVAVEVGTADGRAVLSISDDGVGGADPVAGSGLRGLADRVEALGGRLRVARSAAGGTLVCAELPISERA
jgi:signal transduction histidine kinase